MKTDRGYFVMWFSFIAVNLYKVGELLLHSSDAKDNLLVLFTVWNGGQFASPRF